MIQELKKNKDTREEKYSVIKNPMLALPSGLEAEERRILQAINFDANVQKAERLLSEKIKTEKHRELYGDAAYNMVDILRLCRDYRLRISLASDSKNSMKFDEKAIAAAISEGIRKYAIDIETLRDRVFIVTHESAIKAEEGKEEVPFMLFYHILETDEFALLYSSADFLKERRKVFAWMLQSPGNIGISIAGIVLAFIHGLIFAATSADGYFNLIANHWLAMGILSLLFYVLAGAVITGWASEPPVDIFIPFFPPEKYIKSEDWFKNNLYQKCISAVQARMYTYLPRGTNIQKHYYKLLEQED